MEKILSKYIKFSAVLVFFIANAVYGQEKIINIDNSKLPVINFVGRQKELKEIKARLDEESRIVVSGESGIGKTQFISMFTYGNRLDYDIIWWLDSQEPLANQFKNLLSSIEERICKNKVCSIDKNLYLSQLQRIVSDKQLRVLLVFDNINSSEDMKMLPREMNYDNIHAVYISREIYSFDNDIRLAPLSEQESVLYLDRLSKRQRGEDELREIHRIANGIPAVLEQIYVYISERGLSLYEYRNLYKDRKREVLRTQLVNMTNQAYFPKSTYEFIGANMNFIERKNKGAFSLLMYSLYLSEFFDEDLLKTIHQKINNSTSFHEDISILLKRFALIKMTNGGVKQNNVHKKSYKMHALLKELMFEKVGKNKLHKENISKLLEVVEEYIGEDYLSFLKKIKESNEMLCNLEHILLVADDYEANKELVASLRLKLFYIYLMLFDYDNAEKHLNKVEALLRDGTIDLSKDSDKVAFYYVASGRYYSYKDSNYLRGLELFKKAEVLLSKGKIKNEQLSFLVLIHLSQIYLNKGDLRQAVTYFDKIRKQKSFDSLKKDYRYSFLASKINMERGQYEEALNNIDLCISDVGEKMPKNSKTVIPMYLLKADICIRSNKRRIAKKIISEIGIIVPDYTSGLDIMGARMGGINALVKAKEEYKAAKEEIDKSIGVLENKKVNNQYLAELYKMAGDVHAANSNYEKAGEFYLKAEDAYKNAYHKEMSLDRISILYHDMVHSFLNAGNIFMAKRYFYIHQDSLGYEHPRTEILFQYLSNRGTELK